MHHVVHRAEPADAHLRLRLAAFHADVRHVERRIDPTHAEFDHARVLRIGHEVRHESWRRAAVPPGDHLVVGVEAGLEAIRRDSVIEVVAYVVLARPYDLYRRAAHFLGQQRRFDREVAFRLAPEAAAEQRVVHHHLLRLHADGLGDVVTRPARALQRCPYFPLAVAHAGRRCRRLHRCVRNVRRVVVRRNDLGGRFERGFGIADFTLHLAGLGDIVFQHLLVAVGRVGLVRPIVPGDLQRVAAFHRRPGVFRDHRDASKRRELRGRRRAVNLHDLLDAGHLHRVGRIERGDLAADHRRARDHRILQAVHVNVLAVDRLAGRDVEQVDDPDIALTHVAELVLLLELHLFHRRHRQRCGGGRKLAVPGLAA